MTLTTTRLGFTLRMNIVVSWTHTLQRSPVQGSSYTTGNLRYQKPEMHEWQQMAAFQTALLQNRHSHRTGTALSRSCTGMLCTFCPVCALYSTRTTVHPYKSKHFAWGHPKSSPPKPENTPRAGSPPQKSSISSALRRGHCQYSLFRSPHARVRSEESVH